jgi:predicted amidohydrolase
MIVCNRTGRDHDTQLFDAESIVVDRGEKLLTLRASESTVFIVDCQFSDGHSRNANSRNRLFFGLSDTQLRS